MWERIAQIGVPIEILYPPFVDKDGRVWFFSDGVKRVSPDSGEVFDFSFPAAAFPDVVGSNGRDVVACYEGILMVFSPSGSRIVAPDKEIPRGILAISPYCHKCFNVKEAEIDGERCYLYYYHGQDVSMSVGAYAVLADASLCVLRIGRGEEILGNIGLPGLWDAKFYLLVGDRGAGCCLSTEITVVATGNKLLGFRAVGGMNANLLALVAENVACAIDLSRMAWCSFPAPPAPWPIRYVAVCPIQEQYYLVCVEDILGEDCVNVWSAKIPPMANQGLDNLPVQCTIKSLPFSLE